MAAVDFDGREIRLGDRVTVVDLDWSIGSASWMKHDHGQVIAIGRKRVAIQFSSRATKNFLPGHIVRILEQPRR